ncbi:PAS domain S-box-containing protein [Haloferula luteola]|uniref:histidine kinase n=1 Tax=Haloferula luteola TaxID=595692 RepID=A0A840V2H0_9BACT|nr:PAS domain-containing protein [Haloferula luteola]MBB5352497.1 PAS domain S-box-containing protein [Haloferula luteola]
MEEKSDIPSEARDDPARSLRMALAFCGLLGVGILAVGAEHPAIRAAAGSVGALSIVTLSWNLRRKVGVNSREAEILAERLVAECDELEQKLSDVREEHQTLERFFDALMEHVPSSLYFKDIDSRFLKVNQKMSEWFRCGHPSDMLGKTDHDFFDVSHADDALKDEREIIRTGQAIVGKIEHEEFHDGKKGWVLTNKMPFRDQSGRVIGTFGMSSDVTELMETRNTLERERNMLRSLIDSFPDRIFVRDPGRQYLVVNRSMAEWAGAKSPTEMLGRRPEDFFPQRVTGKGMDEDLDLLAGEREVVIREWVMTDADGVDHSVVTTKVPWFDVDGRCVGIVGMDRDVSAERRARAELAETQRRLQEVMDNSPAVVSMKSRTGTYLMVNRGFEEMFGLDRQVVLGKTDEDVLGDKEVAQAFRERDREVLESGEVLPLDERFYVDGHPRWYATVRFPLRDDRGEIYAVGGVSTDVTDRREAEDSMRRLNEDLVKVNQDLQRAQEQLIQAEKMESIGRLASGVAHEVKNPLAMIGMGLELLARKVPEEDETARETIERMKRGIERAKRIVRGLVDFSSARQFKLDPACPNSVVKDALSLVEYQLRKEGVTVVEELGETLPQVQIDLPKLEQVLVNLLINAQQAMEKGGTITVRTYETRLSDVKRDEGLRTRSHLRMNDHVVCIEVLDTGPGIPEENLKKIYDPFFTTKPTGVGTGLGLAVSRKIVELHQGRLELLNREDGQGALARITLNACPPVAGEVHAGEAAS